MHKLKRALSLVLALCMLLSVLPMSAFALTVTQKPANQTTVGQPFATGTAGSTNFRIPGIVTLNDGTLIAISDARWTTNVDAGGLDTIVSVSKDNGATWEYTFANYLGDNGNTYSERSTCFIDPAIATDGETAYLIADLFPAGVTTVGVKYKAQPGSTGYNDDGNLLLRSDSELGLTFDDSDYAAKAAAAAHNYYLKDGQIWTTTEGTEVAVAGYTVDAYFNVTYTDSENNEVKTNLFFEDSPYKPFPTNYLYMTTSTDGLKWSEPTLLNLKNEDEWAFLVGPGSGIAVDGRMVYTAYEYSGTQDGQRTCLIWRDANGGWHRSEAVTTDTWSSEASVVALADGTLRVFYRDGNSYLSYTDMVWNGETYKRDSNATSVATTAAKRAGSGCMVSSFKYSKQIEDKDVILVSTPANYGARDNGFLYVFLVDPEDKSMELAYAYDITPNRDEDFAYSCITEMKNGDIALLWESTEKNPCAITFSTIKMADVTAVENDTRLTWVDADLWLGESVTYTDYTGDYSSADLSALDTDVAEVEVNGSSITATVGSRMSDSATVVLDNCLYTFTSTGTADTYYISTTLSDGTTVYVEPYATTVGLGCPNVEGNADTLAVQVQAGLSGNQVRLYGNNGGLHFHYEKETPNWNRCGNDTTGGCNVLLLYRPVKDGEESSTEIPGYVQINRSDIESGGQYLIAAQNDVGNTYVLNPVSSTTSADHMAKVTGEQTIATSEITFDAVAVGETQVQIGSVVYTVTVSEKPTTVVEVKEKETVTETVSGAYFASDISGLDTNYATVELAVSGATVSGWLPNMKTTYSMDACEYIFTANDDGSYTISTVKNGVTWYVSGDAKGQTKAAVTNTITWNDDGSVYLRVGTQYLFVYRDTLTWDEVKTTTGFEEECTFYIYGKGEDASSPIPGYKLITSDDDITSGEGYLIAFYDNAQNLYVMNSNEDIGINAYQQMAQVVVDGTAATTTISITGVAEGTTSLILGDDEYKFNITVRDENYDPIAIPSTENVYQGPAITVTEKPENGETVGQPFLTGTGGSANFRIPGIVTLTSGEHSGRIIATTDARWTTTLDGGGLDTLVSVSDNNGANWTYTFANYLGDNGNVANYLSTCIIDPAIGTDGTTAYLIADLFPAGIALNGATYSPVKGNTGFTKDGNLLLRDLAGDTVIIGQSGYNTMAAEREYNYYLDLDTYKIYTANGTLCADFIVDKHFNISYTDAEGTTHSTNLFFADSPFQPYPTDYLYMTTSTDGLNWSEPKLLNLKDADEQVLLVGPGNGTYDAETGNMVFTAYRHTGDASGTAYECTCLIWKDADGNWHRTEDATVNFWSSEASVVALSDGTMRVFYRDGYNILHYTDYKWSDDENNYVRDPNATEVSTTAVKDDGCQLTAITYSKQIEDKEAIIVATPAYPDSRRTDGHLYVFLLNDDNTMELAYDYDIVPDTIEVYAYSCISEMNDGNIALLYEGNYAATNGNAEIIFTTIKMADVTARDNDARLDFVDVTVLTKESVTLSDSTGDYTNANTGELNTNVATVGMTVTSKTTMSGQLGSDANYTGTTIDLANCLYTFTKNGDGNWVINSGDVYLNTNGTLGYPNSNASCTFTIASGHEEGSFYIYSTADSNSDNYTNYLYFDRSARNWNRVHSLTGNNADTWMTNCSMSLFKAVDGEGSGQISGYERVTSLDDVTEGQYLIGAKANDGNWYVAYPTTAPTNRYCQIAKVGSSTTVSTTNITFTGVGTGYSEVQIGSTVYRVTVKEYDAVDVTVAVGNSVSIETTYTGDLTGLDTTYAAAELADGTLTITGVYPGTTSVDLGRTRYNITVTGKVVKVDLTVDDQAAYVGNIADAEMTQLDTNVATVTSGTGYGAQLGSAQSTYAGGYVGLENCLYTFADNGDGTWTVSSTAADGTTVYLQPYASNIGYPNVTSPVAVTLSSGNDDNSVRLYGNGGYLHFHRSSNLYFDRVTSVGNFAAETSFLLYRPAAEGEESSAEIPGFVLVKGKDAVTAGRYLIVAAYNSNYYVLYPSLSTAHRSAQIAHVVSNATTVDITGKSAGETSFRVGSTIYEITVENKIYDVTTAGLDLGNTLGMKFAFEADEVTDWNGAYVQIVKSYANGTADLVEKIPSDQWTKETIAGVEHYVVMFSGVAAKEMTDTVMVTVYNGNNEVISNAWTGSLRDYVMSTLENDTTTAAEKTLLVDMLNYGAAAQSYFGYDTNDLANSKLTAEQQAYASGDVDAQDKRVNGAGYAGSTLALDNDIKLNFVFNMSTVTKAMYAIVTYTDHNGKKQEIRIDGSDFGQYSSTRWRISVTGLSAADSGQLVTCTIYKADNTKVTSASDSVESYAFRSNSKNVMYTMLLKYARSAYEYLHPAG